MVGRQWRQPERTDPCIDTNRDERQEMLTLRSPFRCDSTVIRDESVRAFDGQGLRPRPYAVSVH